MSTLSTIIQSSSLGSTYAPLASPVLTGVPTAPTATAGTNTTQVATTAFVTNAVTTVANFPWTIQTSSFSAASNNAYAVNSSSAVTVTLPASPANNDRIALLDYSQNSAVYNITVANNGNNIEASASSLLININGVRVDLTFISSVGWVITDVGGAIGSNSGQFSTLVASGNAQVSSLGVGTSASGVAGEIRATNNVTAYYSSDSRLKENIVPIIDALSKVLSISGNTYDWTQDYIERHGGEDGYFIRKHDVGVIAQEVEAVLPEAVADRDDGFKAVNYEKLVPLLVQAIKELSADLEDSKDKIHELTVLVDSLLPGN